MSKRRNAIPKDIAARVLFESDRTCCVCRVPGKPNQIHHIDENPSNHDPSNLAVLCIECHHQTQLRGGFDRKLDPPQVTLFRDEWLKRVAKRRDFADELASARAVGVEIRSFALPTPSEGPKVVPEVESGELLTYIRTLPQILREAGAKAQPLYDSGVTAKMMQGAYDEIDVLEQILAHLASWYPEVHFGDRDAKDFVNSMIASRFEWYRAVLEPEGAGTGGTIIGQIAAGRVMADLKEMVADMVSSLTDEEGSLDFSRWRSEW